jgi:Outer membrane protein beta-barrel family
MFKYITALFVTISIINIANAQKASISGALIDEVEKKPVPNAVVALLTQRDSIFYKFTRTDASGSFLLNNVDSGKYLFMTAHRLFADYTDALTITTSNINLKTITLLNKSRLLQAVIVKTGSAIRIKGDTTIYTADSFKVSANANVEELLKKMPGIQVDRNGVITAMGEKVPKVLVDGEEFFGEDPGMAIKNLRADAVKEVQVFDKKSDQAEFTGIDDGKTVKTINLKLKENKKSGYFGKVDAAGGPVRDIDPRYNTNLLFSNFKGKRKLSAYILNGNTGQDALNWEDREKLGIGNENYSVNMDDNGEVSYQWNGAGNDDEPYVNTDNGFMVNTNAGLQYSNKWNDNKTLNLSPKFNKRVYTNTVTNTSQSQFGDSSLSNNGITNTNVSASNFKLNASYDVKLDSNNSIKVSARTSFYQTQSAEMESASTIGGNGVLKNNTNRQTEGKTDKESYFANILYRHRFKKRRRTFSINSTVNFLNSNASNILNSSNNVYKNAAISSSIILKQNRLTDRNTQNVQTNVAFTEPLSKKHAIEFSYQYSFTRGVNNQSTFSFSNTTNKYDELIDSLTNNFVQKTTINKPSVRVSYTAKKIKYSFGSGFGFTNQNVLSVSTNSRLERNFINLFPTANFSYSYASNKSIRVNYNGSTSQPNIGDLQPVRNNNNYFSQFIGNPNLKPAFNNYLNISHNSYNFLKELSFYQSINFSSTSNRIAYSQSTDVDSGKTTIRPINTNGNYAVNFYGGTWFKIKKIGLDVGLNPEFNLSKSTSVINAKENISKTFNSAMSIYLGKSKEKKYDISISNELSNNRNRTTQNNQLRSFNAYTLGLNATVYYKKTWSINTDLNYYVRQKTPDFTTNLSNSIWNARLQKTFKKDEFTAYILVRDILNQNIGINRFFNDNTVFETQNTRLRRFAMIGFAWNFKNKATATK